ncbi:unnamed protein product [Mycena citricolor]|uniref:Mid2 domain-containing protein n=1 Tax=Mycena citricolor TaxID=2018698 RepID=A0AAD2HMJ9_9AGAR|nr:unnamed protein product [Mycena citricolor]
MRRLGRDLVCVILLALRAAAQSSNVTTCISAYSWTVNAQHLTPCLVAAWLESVCLGPTEVDAIPANTHYIGPSTSTANLCLCSTVTYSLISACGACQNRTYTSWTNWTLNCATIQVGTFLEPVPSQVVVPAWAYLNVTRSNNTFDPAAAFVNATESETSSSLASTAQSSATSSSSSSSAFVTSFSPPSSTALPMVDTGKKTNAGAIAGGVVGGLAAVVFAGLGILYYLRRRANDGVDMDHDPASSFAGSIPHENVVTPFPYGSKEVRYPEPSILSTRQPSDDPSMTPAIEIVHRYREGDE